MSVNNTTNINAHNRKFPNKLFGADIKAIFEKLTNRGVVFGLHLEAGGITLFSTFISPMNIS